jgi:tetratricopeptide (TPR) repeat protein
MTIGQLLLGILAGVLAAECCGIFGWLAEALVAMSVRLSYGRSPRALTRYQEHISDLDECPVQVGRLCYAAGLAGRALLDRAAGRAGDADGTADRAQLTAAATAVGRTFRGVDLRHLPARRRRELRWVAARMTELLSRPAEAFDHSGAEALLTGVADACVAYTDFRSERTALSLAEAALEHARQRQDGPSAFDLRYAHAYSLLQLGRRQRAIELLRALSEDEAGASGAGDGPSPPAPRDPQTFRTAQLLLWAMALSGQARQAEPLFRALLTRMRSQPQTDMTLLRHVECKHAWTIGLQGRGAEAISMYDKLIAARIRELGAKHADTLDARHSQGKALAEVLGDGAHAHAVLAPLLADRRRLLGRHHPDTLETRKYLAVADYLTDPASAPARRRTRRELRRIRRIQFKVRGPDHPDTSDTRRWLAALTETTQTR